MAVMASREVVQNGAGVKRSARAVDSSDPNEVPDCLKKLVRTIVRSFYSREHSLIMDLLVRNTIMKEDDLCERLRFEKKQLRQYLHTLKTDQFIKSKVQLETDADGKTAKIIHYFIDYKVREPLDHMLKECDRVHLSSSILEPEIRALEPLPGQSVPEPTNQGLSGFDKGTWANDGKRALAPVESTVTIVLGAQQNSSATVPKERPVWMLESTINTGLGAGLGELDRGGGDSAVSSANTDPITQTLAPGRVPTALHSTSDSTDNTSTAGGGGSGSSQQNSGSSAASSIMQLLIVHERRGLGSHGPKSSLNRTSSSSTNAKTSSSSSAAKNGQSAVSGESGKRDESKAASGTKSLFPGSTADYTVTVNGKQMPYTDITPTMVKTMNAEERNEYIRVGKKFHSDVIFD